MQATKHPLMFLKFKSFDAASGSKRRSHQAPCLSEGPFASSSVNYSYLGTDGHSAIHPVPLLTDTHRNYAVIIRNGLIKVYRETARLSMGIILLSSPVISLTAEGSDRLSPLSNASSGTSCALVA